MNVLVTGANGFMGSFLVEKLLASGHKVKAMVLKGTSEIFLDGLDCEIVYGDVANAQGLKGLLDNIEVVFHLAAIPSIGWTKKIVKVNYGGTKNIFNEAVKAGVRRLVYMSSLVVHGFKHFNEADESTPLIKPKKFQRPYTKSKILSELFLQQNKDKIEVVILRPGYMPFGPRDVRAAENMIGRLAAGKIIPHINHGKAKVSYSYVENICDGAILAGTIPKAAGQIYIITDDNPPYTNMKEYYDLVCAELNEKSPTASIPYRLAYPFVGLVDIIFRLFLRKKLPYISIYFIKLAKYDLYFKSDKAKNELGYKPKILIQEGVRRTVAWYWDVFTKENIRNKNLNK